MNATVILSYTFMYFVLFVIVPFVIVTFVMTCIKFFQTSDVQKAATEVSVKPHQLDMQSMQFLKTLKTLAMADWTHNVHADRVNCASCHQLHVEYDPIIGITAKERSQLCRGCHLDK
ncbi:conserved protein of unknown function [Shewanella benthica]|uniref:Cytochrome c-type protein NrfB-like domain-containing protein n=1 Tax=Shewanella benthica TaxID=43661 RepID=A0A330ME41_9GAMM|nr:hypothetical protein [Shewanella benthica]SQH78067.1 conserved protein of unknown function [Shewanella benthica]